MVIVTAYRSPCKESVYMDKDSLEIHHVTSSVQAWSLKRTHSYQIYSTRVSSGELSCQTRQNISAKDTQLTLFPSCQV